MLAGIANYLLMAAAGIIIMLGITAGYYKIQSDKYQLQVAQITAGLNAAAEKQAVKASAVDQTAIVNKLSQANKDLEKQLGAINAIQNTPKSDDGQVAVVLSRALNGLRLPATNH